MLTCNSTAENERRTSQKKTGRKNKKGLDKEKET